MCPNSRSDITMWARDIVASPRPYGGFISKERARERNVIIIIIVVMSG